MGHKGGGPPSADAAAGKPTLKKREAVGRSSWEGGKRTGRSPHRHEIKKKHEKRKGTANGLRSAGRRIRKKARGHRRVVVREQARKKTPEEEKGRGTPSRTISLTRRGGIGHACGFSREKKRKRGSKEEERVRSFAARLRRAWEEKKKRGVQYRRRLQIMNPAKKREGTSAIGGSAAASRFHGSGKGEKQRSKKCRASAGALHG